MVADPNESSPAPRAEADESSRDLAVVKLQVQQLQDAQAVLERENKNLRLLLERVVEHRQRSHAELVLLLANLVSKLPINDVGVFVAKLVEHNTSVAEACTAFSKGAIDSAIPQPQFLKDLEQSKQDLRAALQPIVAELLETKPPLETEMVKKLAETPESFFSAPVVRATRCYLKGQLPRERVVREFGEKSLVFFTDLTTDPKLNPRPRSEEIVLAFKPDFEALLTQEAAAAGNHAEALRELHRRVQLSRESTETARRQKGAFGRITFLIELLHFYENQSTEAPDVLFAMRLPTLLEQLVIQPEQKQLSPADVTAAEDLLAHIVSLDHRLIVVNNLGKSGGLARVLKFVLRLRVEKLSDEADVVRGCVRTLLPAAPQPAPPVAELAAILKLVPDADRQKLVVQGIMGSDRMKRVDAELLGRAVGQELGLKGLEEQARAAVVMDPEVERQLAWDRIRELMTRHANPSQIAAAIRERLRAKYDAAEVRQSWLVLSEVEPILFIRVFCQLPYLEDGRTDPIAQAVLESYVTRLVHEKYATTYGKVLTSLKSMSKARADSPLLLNFMALVKWVQPTIAQKLAAEIGSLV